TSTHVPFCLAYCLPSLGASVTTNSSKVLSDKSTHISCSPSGCVPSLIYTSSDISDFKAYSLPCLPSSKSASKPLPTPSTVFTLDNTSVAVYAEESNFVLT